MPNTPSGPMHGGAVRRGAPRACAARLLAEANHILARSLHTWFVSVVVAPRACRARSAADRDAGPRRPRRGRRNGQSQWRRSGARDHCCGEPQAAARTGVARRRTPFAAEERGPGRPARWREPAGAVSLGDAASKRKAGRCYRLLSSASYGSGLPDFDRPRDTM
jgi:hypothetical protein